MTEHKGHPRRPPGGWELLLPTWSDSDDKRWQVSAQLKRVGGRLEAVAVRVKPLGAPAPVTQRVLRSIPLERALREFIARHPDVDEAEPCEPFRVTRPTKEISDAELQRVTDVYLDAYESRRPVQRAVADALGIPLSTAAKQIMAARRRGFLPPSSNTPQGSAPHEE